MQDWIPPTCPFFPLKMAIVIEDLSVVPFLFLFLPTWAGHMSDSTSHNIRNVRNSCNVRNIRNSCNIRNVRNSCNVP